MASLEKNKPDLSKMMTPLLAFESLAEKASDRKWVRLCNRAANPENLKEEGQKVFDSWVEIKSTGKTRQNKKNFTLLSRRPSAFY